MKAALISVLALAAVAFSATPLYAAVGPKFSFPVAKAPHPMPLDASLADPAWAAGLVPNGEGPWKNVTTKSPATEATTAYFLYDDKYLYVAIKAVQKTAPVTATQTANDVGFGIDDFVGFGVDVSGAGGQAYYFETTPRGITYQQAVENVRYRPRWQAVATTTPEGWNAVLMVPLSVLKIAPGAKQSWRLQFVRQIATRGEHLLWSWDPLMSDSPAGAWPTFNDIRWWAVGTDIDMAHVKRAKGSARADVFGLASIGQDRNLFVQANGQFLPMQVRPVGIDFSYPLTPTMSFVGTLNPDFSNVEVDQQTITPQEFQRQLTEYRPFFAQGANFINASSGTRSPAGPITSAPYLAFYSPNVGPFDRGFKVEGTFGHQSLGVLTFRGFDETTGNTFDDQAYGYLHAMPDGSFQYWSDGVLAHHSLYGNDTTIEAGAEGRDLKNGWIWYVDHSFENGDWVPQGHADMSEIFIDRHKPTNEFLIEYLDVSPNYNPIDGYTANSDIRGPSAFLQFFGASPAVKNWSLFMAADRYNDESGAVHQADTQVFLNATFKNGFSLDGVGSSVGQLRSYGIPQGPGCNGPIVGTSYFTGYPCYRDGVTTPFNLYNIPIGYLDGTPTPYDVNYSWGPFGGNYVHLFNMNHSRPLGRRLTIALSYNGTWERSLATGQLDSQWLRSVTLGYNITSQSTFTFALRNINGYGGFATQVGNNVALAYHQRFPQGNELYVNFGSPAAGVTLNRLIVKYVFHAGADSGT